MLSDYFRYQNCIAALLRSTKRAAGKIGFGSFIINSLYHFHLCSLSVVITFSFTLLSFLATSHKCAIFTWLKYVEQVVYIEGKFDIFEGTVFCLPWGVIRRCLVLLASVATCCRNLCWVITFDIKIASQHFRVRPSVPPRSYCGKRNPRPQDRVFQNIASYPIRKIL